MQHPDPAAPIGPALDLEDPEVVRRFTAAYTGQHDPRDALWWVRHPEAPSPSGRESPAAALRSARRAVYRPDAREDDRRRVQALASALEEDEAAVRAALEAAAAAAAVAVPPPVVAAAAPRTIAPAAPPAPPRPARAWPVAVGAVAAAAALVAVGIASSGSPRPAATPVPTVESTPIPFLGGPATVARSRADLAALFAHPSTAFLGLYLARHSTTLSSSIRSNSIAKDATAVGTHTFSLAGLQNDQATGLLTVLLTCSRPSSYAWALTAPGTKPIRVHGADCHGNVVSATFVPKPHHVPTELRVSVPRDVRVIVEMDLSRY